MEILQILFDKVKELPKTYFLPIGIGCIGLLLFGYGLVNYFRQNISETSPQAEVQRISEPVKIVKTILIDVEGAVGKAGVYSLLYESRLQDALVAAGGLAENADRNFIEKHMNLASKVTDGAKIYIPRVGENKVLGATDQSANTSTDANAQVNINSASADALDALPGIGKTTAQKIIDNRPYADIQDLLTKKITSQKIYNAIKDKITLM